MSLNNNGKQEEENNVLEGLKQQPSRVECAEPDGM